jgi:hypothetical protein
VFWAATFILRTAGVRIAAGLLEGPAQQELDLRVEAAQIVVRPPLDGLQQRRIDTKQEGFPIRHDAYW